MFRRTNVTILATTAVPRNNPTQPLLDVWEAIYDDSATEGGVRRGREL